MRSAHFLRAEYSCRNSVAHPSKVGSYEPKRSLEVCRDVLEKKNPGTYLDSHPPDVGPQPACIIPATTLSGIALSLARVPASEEIHKATPRSAVEGLEIVPDRSDIQRLVAHPRHESGRGSCFPFNVTNGPYSLPKQEPDAEGKPPPSGAEVKGGEVSMPGT